MFKYYLIWFSGFKEFGQK